MCHSLVDTEKSTYKEDELMKWKNETELYVQELVIQDTRLRQLRILSQNYLSALRILSALPEKLDQTYEHPSGNGINITRLFFELELILFDNHFIEEASKVKLIRLDLDTVVCPFVNNNKSGNSVNVSVWKNTAVFIFMVEIMRYKKEAFNKYLEQETSMVNKELDNMRSQNFIPPLMPMQDCNIKINDSI